MEDTIARELLAAAGLVACAVMLACMALPRPWRHLLAAWWLRLAQGRGRRRAARVEAAQAIERARRSGQVERQGNLYRPKAWDDDSRPPTLH